MMMKMGSSLATIKKVCRLDAPFTPRRLKRVRSTISAMAIAFIWNCVSPGIKSTRAVGMATAMAAIEPELASIHCVNPYIKPSTGW